MIKYLEILKNAGHCNPDRSELVLRLERQWLAKYIKEMAGYEPNSAAIPYLNEAGITWYEEAAQVRDKVLELSWLPSMEEWVLAELGREIAPDKPSGWLLQAPDSKIEAEYWLSYVAGKSEELQDIAYAIAKHLYIEHGGSITSDKEINGGDLVEWLFQLFQEEKLDPDSWRQDSASKKR